MKTRRRLFMYYGVASLPNEFGEWILLEFLWITIVLCLFMTYLDAAFEISSHSHLKFLSPRLEIFGMPEKKCSGMTRSRWSQSFVKKLLGVLLTFYNLLWWMSLAVDTERLIFQNDGSDLVWEPRPLTNKSLNMILKNGYFHCFPS